MPEIWIGAPGDSTMDGLGPGAPAGREAQDTNWPNVYQALDDGTITSDTTPLETIAFTNGGNDRFSFLEYFGKTRSENIGAAVYLIQCAVGGAQLADGSWGVGQVLSEDTIAKANLCIASILDAEPTAVLKGFVDEVGSNDSEYDPFYTRYAACLADLRSNIFMNGVSGETAEDAGVIHLFVAQCSDGHLALSAGYLGVDWARRDVLLATEGGRYYFHPTAGDGDLHWFTEGVRNVGTGAANLLEDSTPPTISVVTDYSIPANGPYQQELVGADSTNWYLSGTDAADFEIVREAYSPDPGFDKGRTRHTVQWAGAAPASGTYNFTINALSGNGVHASEDVEIVVGVAPYTTPEEILATVPDVTLVGWGEAVDLSNGAVASWTNKAGTSIMGHLAQATGGSQPAKAATSYNSAKPGVTFDGSADFMSATLTGIPAGSLWHAFAAWQQAAGSETDARLISLWDGVGSDDDGTGYIPIRYKSGTADITSTAGTWNSLVDAPDDEAHVYSTTLREVEPGVVETLTYRDGIQGTDESFRGYTTSFAPTSITIGQGNSAGNISGTLAGYVVCIGTLPAAPRIMVESYLSTLA